MKTLLLSTTLAALALGSLPVAASPLEAGTYLSGATAIAGPASDDGSFERRGRGRGGDDRANDDRRGGSGGHGGRPRVPGGSGCDDPEDIIEHPECRI
jgi:hypothetical protein